MTEANEQEGGKTPLRLRPGKLELKKTVDAGQIRQSFSHGRSKAVAVEVRKKRTFAAGAGGELAEVKDAPKPAPTPPTPAETAEAKEAAKPAPAAPVAHPPHPPRELTDDEKAHRLHALQAAKKAEEEARRLAQIRAEQDAKEAAEAAKRHAEEAANRAAQPQSAEEAEAPAAEAGAVEAEATPSKTSTTPVKAKTVEPPRGRQGARDMVEEEEEPDRRRPGRVAAHKPPAAKRLEPKRRTGKLTVTAALDDDDRSERGRSLAAVRRARERERLKNAESGQAEKIVRDVVIPETITVQELANRMAARGAEVIKALMRMGVMASINQSIDADTAELVVGEFGHSAKRVSDADVEIGLSGAQDSDEQMIRRPPVVTVMGHVDHGKTSLLDALRETDVASGEAGGITQHIGAYQVSLKNGQKITFIDTPGHEAFTAMRARGAAVTDVVVLVVAADDGIMPQTVEAIRHAKAAKVPIVVAVNKIDKPDAKPERVRQELLNHEIVVEEMGGEVLAIDVSAKKKIGLDKLEEAILLQSEILDLRANPNRAAAGVVVEAKMEKGRGSVATVLVQKGTLHQGDIFVAGAEWGRVRALADDRGHKIEAAGPAMPVEVLGLQGTPAAGDDFIVVETEARAREVAGYRQRKSRDARHVASARGTLEQMFQRIQAGEAKELPVVIKGDVQGSVEALVGTLSKLGSEEVKVRVLHSAVGGINESDVTLARASNALIVGFNVRANPQARDIARRDGVDIRYYSIIYDVADDLKKALTGMLAPTVREKFLGNAEIREVFSISKVGKVAGCRVTEGVVKRGARVRLLRDSVVIFEGALAQLKRFKDDVREVQEGYECGMSLENYNDIQTGDVIECFEMEEVAATL
ncbi:MAG: translation initiation factor IF-2 [Rhodospirillales bacterium]|nr:translation initiation factor IF-2 [Rhodospirillales bacterium]